MFKQKNLSFLALTLVIILALGACVPLEAPPEAAPEAAADEGPPERGTASDEEDEGPPERGQAADEEAVPEHIPLDEEISIDEVDEGDSEEQTTEETVPEGGFNHGDVVVFKDRGNNRWLKGEYKAFEAGYDNPHDVNYTETDGKIHVHKGVYKNEIMTLSEAQGEPDIIIANDSQKLPTEQAKVIAHTPTFENDISCPTDTTIVPKDTSISEKTHQDKIVQMHNDARGTNPPVVWDDTLAQFAQGWADGIHEFNQKGYTGNIPNSPHSGKTCYARVNGGPYYGENITSGNATLAAAVQAWIDEKPNLTAEYSCKSAAEADECGHYLQVVHHLVTKVGCGHNAASSWVCSYNTFGARGLKDKKDTNGMQIYDKPWAN